MHLGANLSETNSAKWKTPRELPEQLHRRLNCYALAAGAAGVAILACSVPVDAAPVCTKLHIDLVGTGTYALNPAHQRVPPFNIAETYNNVSSLLGGSWNRGFFIPNWVGAMPLLGANNLPADVRSGASIGPRGNFAKGPSYGMLFTYGIGKGTINHHKGNLQFGQSNYIGFKFGVAGESHYGWVRMNVTFEARADGKMGTMHIHGYGYETTPNKAIHAGQCSATEQASEPSAKPNPSPTAMPTTARKPQGRDRIRNNQEASASALGATATDPAMLGLLALGAPGRSIWRREER
jgi:hypothetical protein